MTAYTNYTAMEPTKREPELKLEPKMSVSLLMPQLTEVNNTAKETVGIERRREILLIQG